MTDLEGNELEVGTVYLLPGNTSYLTFGRFSHETITNCIFKTVEYNTGNTTNILYSWKRQVPKQYKQTMVSVIKMSQDLMDRYQVV